MKGYHYPGEAGGSGDVERAHGMYGAAVAAGRCAVYTVA
jgi:hypothetical protein